VKRVDFFLWNVWRPSFGNSQLLHTGSHGEHEWSLRSHLCKMNTQLLSFFEFLVHLIYVSETLQNSHVCKLENIENDSGITLL
jgi:hypothetical protein